MGSPPAPHLANGWLSRFDGIIKGDSQLYERYMDDVLCSAKRDSVSTRLNYVNSLHPCLNFTYELENDEKSIAFFDMLISYESMCNVLNKVNDAGERSGLKLNAKKT